MKRDLDLSVAMLRTKEKLERDGFGPKEIVVGFVGAALAEATVHGLLNDAFFFAQIERMMFAVGAAQNEEEKQCSLQNN